MLREYPVTEALECIVEEKNLKESPSYYLQGYFLMASKPNKNRRVYNLTEMLNEVKNYSENFIKRSRALGELNHPQDSTEINLERACWNLCSLEQKDECYFYGKAKILSTPSGVVLQNLVKDGITLGASSRALGRIVPRGDTNLVEGFKLIAIDCVHEPSLDKAILDSIMENRQYIIDQGGKVVELACDSLACKMNSLPKKDVNEYLKEAFASFIQSLKG